MKKFIKVSVLCLASLTTFACAPKDPDPVVETISVTGIDMESEVAVDCDWDKQLEVTVLPENASNKKVTWESSDPKIATVDENGLVTGVSNGVCKITATTEDGGLKAECEVTVTGLHKSKKVWQNFGKIELNTSYNASEGYKDFTVLTDNEDYTEVKFNRKEVRDWASLRCWYDSKVKGTSFDVDVELVEGNLPAILMEISGEANFKQFQRIPLKKGEITKFSTNITDYNIQQGEKGNGSWGFIFFEFENPMDETDTGRENDEEVVLRLHKVALRDDTAKKPSVVNNLIFDEVSKKLVFDKDTAAAKYEIELLKGDTKIELETQPTRFNSIESFNPMRVSFTPKKDQNFAKIPGEYKARMRTSNSAGTSDWCEYISFTVTESEFESEFVGINFSENKFTPNEWNGNKTYKAELVEEGYLLSFTGNSTAEAPSWDSFVINFDKTQPFKKFAIEYIIQKGNIKNIGFQFNDWSEVAEENEDGKQQEFVNIEGKSGLIRTEFDIKTDLSKGLGNLGLMFDRDANNGECEILVKKISLLKDGEYDSYVANNFSNNGDIYPNQWNGNKTYKAERAPEGYKLSFTSSAAEGNPSWDSFLLDFNKEVAYKKFNIEFEIVKSEKALKNILIQFNDWGDTETTNTDGLQQEYVSIPDGQTGVFTHEFVITTDLSKGLGTIGLGFDRDAGIGDVEIVIKSIGLKL